MINEKGIHMNLETLFKTVLNTAFMVHSELGPGLLESAYEQCLYFELINKGLQVDRQHPMPVIYKKVKLNAGYRCDLLVEGKIIVEIKSVDSLADIHIAQVLTYLKLSGCRLALLVNFNVAHLKEGIRRVIH
jgi:GxxExxY protein